MYTIHPNNHECFYLRLLLHTVKGPTSFETLRTTNGIVHQTFRDACLELGLLEDDNQWDLALSEAVFLSHPIQIRTLFAIILTTCSPSDPIGLWNKHKESMAEDILNRVQKENSNMKIELNEIMLNEALIHLEDKCIEINNKELHQLGLPSPERTTANIYDKDLLREMQYNPQEMKRYVDIHKKMLNEDQLKVYETIMHNIDQNNGGTFFLDAPGGTGKTFLLNIILAEVRSRQQIAIAVASTGIAATILEGGRTAHSTFKLPLNYMQNEQPMCNINKNSGINLSYNMRNKI